MTIIAGYTRKIDLGYDLIEIIFYSNSFRIHEILIIGILNKKVAREGVEPSTKGL